MCDISGNDNDPDNDLRPYIVYYSLNDALPVKVTNVNHMPENIEVYSQKEKRFIRDMRLISLFLDDDDFSLCRITETEYRNLCLSIGVKPICKVINPRC